MAHLTNGDLSKTTFWDKLQQKECKSVGEFYKKTSKFLNLENFKEAFYIRLRRPLPVKIMVKESKMRRRRRKEVRREKQKIRAK